MKNPETHYWIAVCIGHDEVNNKIVASCLTFFARNRFYALEALRGMLPENDSWVRPDGTTRPFRILEMHQCRPQDSDRYMHQYLSSLYDLLGLSESSGPLVA
jgi:hypothetical protein